jgi:lipopolysaccharide transport system ATP-binding protein
VALDVDHVFKKFKRGEVYDSLRDLIPALTGRLLRGARSAQLGRQEFWALDDLSFQVRRGEAFGIIGANGAGKSTILKILTGIMKPTRGTVRVHGRLSALIEVSAGFHQDLTGRENVYLNGAILGMSRAEIRRRFDEIVAFSGLEEFIDTPVKRYSSGMFARLGFSVAAHVDPDVLLVDEVLSVGDYLFQRKCVEHMDRIIAGGATIVFVSHNLRAVANLCQRSLLLERGRMSAIGPTTDVLNAYVGRGTQGRAIRPESEVEIVRVLTAGSDGPATKFTTGDCMRITVEAEAHRPVSDLAVVVQITDAQQYPVFDTCTQRLGAGPLALRAGERLRCSFDVDVRLAEGTFHVGVALHRYVTSSAFDRWLPATTFFVAGAPEIRGIVDLQPRLAECDIRPGAADPPAPPDPPRREPREEPEDDS